MEEQFVYEICYAFSDEWEEKPAIFKIGWEPFAVSRTGGIWFCKRVPVEDPLTRTEDG